MHRVTLLFTVAILLLLNAATSNAACLGEAADTCLAGLYEIPCGKLAAELCCFPCEQPTVTPVPAQAVAVPIEAPLPPPPPPVVVADPAIVVVVDPRCPVFAIAAVTGNACLSRGVPIPYPPVLTTCPDLDSLLSDIEIAQRPKHEEHRESTPNWLTTGAFQNNCPDVLKHFALAHVEFKESRGCRGVYHLDVTYVFGELEYASVPANCYIPTDRPGTLELTESFSFPTRQPSTDELEAPAVLLADRNLQCLSDLPAVESHLNRTLFVGTDCMGGAVPVTYHLRKEVMNLPPSTRSIRNAVIPGEQATGDAVCLDRKKIVRHWETRHPVTGEVCSDDTLKTEFRIEDTQPPTFIELQSMLGVTTGESLYVLECYGDLAKFKLEYTDNCDKTRRQAITTTAVVNNVTIAGAKAQCENHARADVVFIARDSCDNEIRRTVGFLILDTHPPTPLQAITGTVHKTCRRHIPPAQPMEALDNCMVNQSMPLQFPLFHQDYTFTHVVEEEVANEVQEGDDPQPRVLCENDMTITQTWQLSDGCSLPINITRKIVIKDVDAPLWISSYLPPEASQHQCRRDIAPFDDNMVLLAKDDCDQIEIRVVGVEEDWGPEDDSTPECKDNTRLVRTWEASDTCKNKRTHTHVIDILDTTPPALVDKFEERVSHFCLSHADQIQHNFICFPNMKEKMIQFVLPDNCGEDIYMDFDGIESYSCSNDESIESCETPLEFVKGTISSEAIYRNHYYAHNDTLCISKRASQLHFITFTASDVCGNEVDVTIDIFAPKRTTDDQAYNPRYPTHPCDDRTIIQLPTQFFEPTETFIGDIYMANKIDPRAVPRTVPSGARSKYGGSLSGEEVVYFTMAIVIGVWLLL
jgi:hypothetical protein